MFASSFTLDVIFTLQVHVTLTFNQETKFWYTSVVKMMLLISDFSSNYTQDLKRRYAYKISCHLSNLELEQVQYTQPEFIKTILQINSNIARQSGRWLLTEHIDLVTQNNYVMLHLRFIVVKFNENLGRNLVLVEQTSNTIYGALVFQLVCP